MKRSKNTQHRWGPVFRAQLGNEAGVDFDFVRVHLIPYLTDLRVRAFYFPPLFRAPSWSEHGYDGLCPWEVDPRHGTEAQFRACADALRAAGIARYVDIVPNHANLWPGGENDLWKLHQHDPDQLEMFFDVKIDRATGQLTFRRRFFDIWNLIGWRQEILEVFLTIHQKVLEWLRDGYLDGVRVDHPDGLWDPAQYFARLRRIANLLRSPAGRKRLITIAATLKSARAGELLLQLARGSERTPKIRLPRVIIVTEKIRARDEAQPFVWQVDSCVGYPFGDVSRRAATNAEEEVRWTDGYRTFCNRKSRRELNDGADESRKDYRPFDVLVQEAKLQVVSHTLCMEPTADGKVQPTSVAPEVKYLHGLVKATGLKVEDIQVSIASLAGDRYRVYPRRVRSRNGASRSRWDMPEACRRAIKASHGMHPTIRRMLLQPSPRLARELGVSWSNLVEFVYRLPMCMAPVTAIGKENIAGFRFPRLLGLCDVGCNPEIFGATSAEVHAFLLAKQQQEPHGWNLIDSHDSKLNHAAAMRTIALTHFAAEWVALCEQWHCENEHLWTLDQRCGRVEWQLYQVMAATWAFPPDDFSLARRKEYVLKAIREFRDPPDVDARETHWWPYENPGWEAAVLAFLEALHDPERSSFLDSFVPFIKKVDVVARQLGLAQLLLMATAPGVPSFYQGDDVWQLCHVDPDNRRRQPWVERHGHLRRLIKTGKPDAQTERMHVIRTAAWVREQLPGAFDVGAYIPDDSWGEQALAFYRGDNQEVYVWLARRTGVQKPPPPDGYDDRLCCFGNIGLYVKR